MTTEQINKLALTMESVWSNVFYKKDHASLVGAITMTMADVEYKRANDEIKDYAGNYDNAPTVATLAKLCHQSLEKRNKKPAHAEYVRPKYFEDADGYGYYFPDPYSCDCECIWKPSMAKQGITKMETLKKYGLIEY